MFKHFLLAVALVSICSCTTTSPATSQSLRLDATSDATAQESFQRMLRQAGAEKQRELAMAMLKLNMTGVESAYEVVANPELQSPSIARVKDRIAGMTADEIIELADRASDVRIEVHDR